MLINLADRCNRYTPPPTRIAVVQDAELKRDAVLGHRWLLCDALFRAGTAIS